VGVGERVPQEPLQDGSGRRERRAHERRRDDARQTHLEEDRRRDARDG
jgi:hypothetical protein